MIYKIIVQVIGVVGMIFGFMSYQSNHHKNIMLTKTVSEAIFALQYFLLGFYTGMAMDIISVVRDLLFAKIVEKNKSTIPYIGIFSAIMIIAGIFTWKGAISIFAVLGKILTTIAYGMKSPKLVRLITVPSCVSWIIYNINCFSLAGICTEILGLLSILVAFFRYDMKSIKKNV